MIFITYDYNKKTKTEWYRQGKCNHCGECCRVIIHIYAIEHGNNPRNGGVKVDEIGVWHQYKMGGNIRYWQITEIEKEETEDCYLKTNCPKEGKLPICKAWP